MRRQKGASTYRRSSKRAAELDERPTHERAAAIAALSVRDMVLQRHDVVMVRPSSLALAGASGNGPLFGTCSCVVAFRICVASFFPLRVTLFDSRPPFVFPHVLFL